MKKTVFIFKNEKVYLCSEYCTCLLMKWNQNWTCLNRLNLFLSKTQLEVWAWFGFWRFGRVFDRHTRSLSSSDSNWARFLCLMVVRAENPNSHRYVVENCTRSLSAFWAIAGYSFSTSNQNTFRLSSKCFHFNVLSFRTLASSSSSINVNNNNNNQIEFWNLI